MGCIQLAVAVRVVVAGYSWYVIFLYFLLVLLLLVLLHVVYLVAQAVQFAGACGPSRAQYPSCHEVGGGHDSGP